MLAAITRVSFGTAVLMAASCTDDSTAPSPNVAASVARIRLETAFDVGSPGIALDTVSAIVVDASNKLVVGANIQWLVERGGGSVRPLSAQTDARGVARAIWTLGPNSGESVLTATAGRATGRLTAFASVGFPATVIAIGGTHTCAIATPGTTYCWGSNTMGQLGIGTTGPRLQTTPVRVTTELRFTSLVAGVFHTCGLTSTGEAFCWGGSPTGQIGFALPFAETPMPVEGNHRFTVLAAGSHYTCGLTTGGSILCWGDDTVGQLGNGRDRSSRESFGQSARSRPTPIVSNLSFTALSAAFTATCAIATTGQTYCWGDNRDHTLGTVGGTCRMLADPYYDLEDWNQPCSTKPLAIDSRVPVTSLTSAGFDFCGLTGDGRLLCWGDDLYPPTILPGVRVSNAWVPGHFVCGLDASQTVGCWGFWNGGVPTAPPWGNGPALVKLSSVGSGSCGLTRDEPSIAYCWGTNEVGQLGDGTTRYRNAPVAVALPRRSE